MKMKKVLSIALSGILAVSMLAGCGATSNVSKDFADGLKITDGATYKTSGLNALIPVNKAISDYVSENLKKEADLANVDADSIVLPESYEQKTFEEIPDSLNNIEKGVYYAQAFAYSTNASGAVVDQKAAVAKIKTDCELLTKLTKTDAENAGVTPYVTATQVKKGNATAWVVVVVLYAAK